MKQEAKGSDPVVVECFEAKPDVEDVEAPSEAETLAKDIYDESLEIMTPVISQIPREDDSITPRPLIEEDETSSKEVPEEPASMPVEETPADEAAMPPAEQPAEASDMPPQEPPAEASQMPPQEAPADKAEMPEQESPEEPEPSPEEIAKEQRLVREITSDRETDQETDLDEKLAEIEAEKEKRLTPQNTEERGKAPESDVTVVALRRSLRIAQRASQTRTPSCVVCDDYSTRTMYSKDQSSGRPTPRKPTPQKRKSECSPTTPDLTLQGQKLIIRESSVDTDVDPPSPPSTPQPAKSTRQQQHPPIPHQTELRRSPRTPKRSSGCVICDEDSFSRRSSVTEKHNSSHRSQLTPGQSSTRKPQEKRSRSRSKV